jgi:hypothetical protein
MIQPGEWTPRAASHFRGIEVKGRDDAAASQDSDPVVILRGKNADFGTHGNLHHGCGNGLKRMQRRLRRC